MPRKDKHKDKDQLLFSEDETPSESGSEKKPTGTWKLLIVDDDKEVHTMTKLVLSDYCFENRGLEFLSAYSGEHARTLLKEHPDSVVILLDVVMETKEAGLDLAKYIRETLKNEKLRIVLRTGQPGSAPEKSVIVDYDINDYKEKTELTSDKLFTSITTAIRSYKHLDNLEKKNRRLNEEIARRIVAESNLAKYNKSLERMIEEKRTSLNTAMETLKKAESHLKEARKTSPAGMIVRDTVKDLSVKGEDIKQKLTTIDRYRKNLSSLIEKYGILQNIMDQRTGEDRHEKTLADIRTMREKIDIHATIKNFPDIIRNSEKGIEFITDVVSDIQTFTQINQEPFARTDINGIVSRAIGELQPRFSGDIHIKTELSDIPEVQCPPRNMERAVKEILKNAFESVDSRGFIHISTSFSQNTVSISVNDTGGGIVKPDLEKIFQPYFTKHKKKARGLGLTFARSVLSGMDGSITVESTRKVGTHVTAKLPVVFS